MTTDSPASGRPPREPGPVGQLARLFLVQLLAVIAVAAVIAIVFTAAGRGTGRLRADGGSSGSGATASATTTPAPSTTSATPATPATSPSAATTATGSPAAPPASATPPSASAGPASPTAVPTTSAGNDRPRVDVLNQSSPGGTAAHTADNVSTLGWRVGRIDNFVGNVRATTVYYPPGLGARAKELAKALPGPQRVLPGFSTLSDSRLSLILVG